ncbi:hypothetical protein [Caminibacter mediatlanticus]|uniref:Periplasmic heavy metal sensor n=1 Tax=Caminibacter mediatlanticus TB-2 TaxID=391592 RepID=A0AAI9AHR5_9BACT|nr:hypothetical protein [Caminibacter mediatlanticus]EDM23830.1 hypothetical protein CMTB2_01144 [Caminibacter mediatlanticus TB-2]
MRVLIMFIFLISFVFADIKNVKLPYDLSKLNLTKIQKQKLKKAIINYRKKLNSLHTKEEIIEYKVQKEFLKDFEYRNLLKEKIEVKKKLIENEFEFLKQLHTILNKTQRKKFIKQLKEWEIE